MEVAALVQRSNRHQMNSRSKRHAGATENSSGNNGQARKSNGANWDEINAKTKVKRAESRMVIDYEEVR